MNIQNDCNCQLRASFKSGTLAKDFAFYQSTSKNVNGKRQVHFSRNLDVIESNESISEEERVQLWWQSEDYFGFQWQISIQLRSLHSRLAEGLEKTMALAETLAAKVTDEDEIELVIQAQPLDTVSVCFTR